MTEIFKDIPNWEGFYQASNLGRIKSLHGRKFAKTSYREKGDITLKPSKGAGNYFYVHLSKIGKNRNYLISRLVAETFIPNPENKPQVNHKDGDKTNNALKNLEWMTAKENCNHALDNEIYNDTRRRVKQIKDGKLIKIWRCQREAARALGLHSINICQTCLKKRPSAGGFYWEFA